MTRVAAMDGYRTILSMTVDATRDAFSVERALEGSRLHHGGAVIDRIRSHTEALEAYVVEPELDSYRRRSIRQFEVVLDYVEGDDPIAAYRDELLEHDGYLETLRDGIDPETREHIEDAIVSLHRERGEAIEPIVTHPSDAFWVAAASTFDRDDAVDLIERIVPFTGPLQAYREHFRFAVDLDPSEFIGPPGRMLPSVRIDYTAEAIRALTSAERRVIDALIDEVRTRSAFDEP